MRAGLRTPLLLLAILGIAGSVAAARQSRTGGADSWTAPAPAAAAANPLTAGPQVVAGGAKVFEERCAQCHGRDAGGSGVAPDLTAVRVRRQSDGALYWKISHGNAYAGMPAFSFLPPARRWQLVLFLRHAASAQGAR